MHQIDVNLNSSEEYQVDIVHTLSNTAQNLQVLEMQQIFIVLIFYSVYCTYFIKLDMNRQ